MSLVISEVLANPVGKDTEGEFIEVFNNSDGVVSLSGYSLSDKSGKSFNLSGEINSLEYKVFYYSDTRISINNSEEIIYLSKDGFVVDEVSLTGIEEGLSLVRVGESFVFTDKITPGEGVVIESENKLSEVSRIDNSDISNVVVFGFLISIIFGFIVWWVYSLLTLYE